MSEHPEHQRTTEQPVPQPTPVPAPRPHSEDALPQRTPGGTL